MARESLPPSAPGLQPGQRLAVIDADGRVVEVVETAPAEPRTPTADVVRITPFRHTRELRVYCPYCAEEHWHGLGWENRDREQFRLAHCGKGSYRIVVPSRAAELVRPMVEEGSFGLVGWYRGDVAVARPKAFDIVRGVRP